jgi:hypothetical protein
MTYTVATIGQRTLFVDDTTKRRLAEYDGLTGFASVEGVDVGRFSDPTDAQTEIASILGGTPGVDTSSPDNSTGVGPFVDKQGNTYRVDPLNYNVWFNESQVLGWAYKLCWKRDHNGGAGVMWQHGPAKNPTHTLWYATRSGFPVYDPTDEGEVGATTAGLHPHDNSAPPTDSADETFGVTVNFYDAVWTRGSASGSDFIVLRDGVPFLTEVCVNFLVYDDGDGAALYWVDSDDIWYEFSPGNGRLLLGLDADPRDGPPPPPSDTWFDWEVTANLTSGSNIISGIPATEWGTLEVGMWLIAENDSSLLRGVLRTDKGLGGSFPSVGVANVGSLGSSSAGTLKYITSNGECYKCNGGTSWTRVVDVSREQNYYYGMVLARSYHGRIKTILGSGSVEMCDVGGTNLNAQRSATGVRLVVNNIPTAQAFIDALADGATGYELPNLLLPGAGALHVRRETSPGVYAARSNFELTAVSETAGFWSPRGVAAACMQALPNGTSVTFSNLSLHGNYDFDNHSANWEEGPSTGLYHSSNPNPTTDEFQSQQNHHGFAIQHNPGCHGGRCDNVWTHDYPAHLVNGFCDDVWYNNIKIRQDAPQMTYTGWSAWHADGSGGGLENSDIRSAYSLKGPEGFKHQTLTWRNNYCENVIFAVNNAQVTMTNNTIVWKVDSQFAESYQSPHDAIVQISKNIGGGFADLGVVVDGLTITLENFVYKSCATKVGVEVNTDTIAIPPRITNLTFTAPDAVSTAGASVDNGTSALAYLSGCRALNAAKSLIGNVTTQGRSPRYSNVAQAQWSSIRMTNGSTLIGGTTRTTDPDFVTLHGFQDIDHW